MASQSPISVPDSELQFRTEAQVPNSDAPADLPKPIQEKISASLQRLVETFRAIEIENLQPIYDRDFPASRVQLLRIVAPTREQLNPVYDEITMILGELRGQKHATDSYRRKADALLQDYAGFPNPVKALLVTSPKNPARPLSLVELYANNEAAITPDADGSVTMPEAGRGRYKSDDDLGSEKSWARKRYGHLALENSRDGEAQK